MHYFPDSPPEHPVIKIFCSCFHKQYDLFLNFIKSTKILMSLCYKRWLDIRKDITQAKSLSM